MIRRIVPGICALLLAFPVPLTATETPHAKLRALYAKKEYFALRDALEAVRNEQSAELLFFRGVVSNKFNRPHLSIKLLENYLKQTKEYREHDLLVECYELLADNYSKTYQYLKASEAYNRLATRFRDKINPSDKEDYENARKLWRALAKAPAQMAVFKGNSVISKDREGHIPIEINGQRLAFIFDTGANLSVITSSLAAKLGLEIFKASIDVKAIAGNQVKADLAIARKTLLGNVTIHNAVFLVFDDKDLYVSEADFQINGLIGFPIIEALSEVTFVRSTNEIWIPATPTKGGSPNMCLDGLLPLIAGWVKGERLIFALDTGADSSVLYQPFYERYEAEIKGKFEAGKERVRGVGGHKEIKSYLAKNIVVQISGKDARFDQIPILTEQTTSTSRHFYGNLGQDLLKQFEKMTLNFQSMTISLE